MAPIPKKEAWEKWTWEDWQSQSWEQQGWEEQWHEKNNAWWEGMEGKEDEWEERRWPWSWKKSTRMHGLRTATPRKKIRGGQKKEHQAAAELQAAMCKDRGWPK